MHYDQMEVVLESYTIALLDVSVNLSVKDLAAKGFNVALSGEVVRDANLLLADPKMFRLFGNRNLVVDHSSHAVMHFKENVVINVFSQVLRRISENVFALAGYFVDVRPEVSSDLVLDS